MAYVYVCDSCLDGKHDCEHERDRPPPDSLICGGGHCICGCENGKQVHPDSTFVASVRRECLAIKLRRGK